MADLAIKRLRFTGKACASPTAVDHVRPPVPAAGQVLVAVHAVCLVQMDMPKLGCAFSGTVVFAPPAPSTGDSTTQIVPWQAGDKVWGRNDAGSTLAEIVAVPAYALRKMKTDRTFVECATLGGPALLACRALQQAALDPDGKPKILVHGAHTGLGTFLIQFAKVMRLEVECTLLPSQLAVKQSCSDLGADDFVNLEDERPYGKTLASFRGRRERNFSAVVDCLGTDTSLFDKMAQYTLEGAKFLTVKPQSISWKAMMLKLLSGSPREYITLDASLMQQDAAQQLELVQRCIDSPDFQEVEVSDIVNLADADRAIAKVMSHEGFGCVVVEVMSAKSEDLGNWLTYYHNVAETWSAGNFAMPEPPSATKSSRSRRMSTASRKSRKQHASTDLGHTVAAFVGSGHEGRGDGGVAGDGSGGVGGGD